MQLKKSIFFICLLLFTAVSANAQLASQDVWGGRIDSVCNANPRLPSQTNFTGASQSGTTGTIPLANTSGYVVGEPVMVEHTGTLMDSVPTSNSSPSADGVPRIASISTNVSITLTMPSSNTVASAAGNLSPAFWYPGLITSGPFSGQTWFCDPLHHAMFIEALSEFQPINNGATGGLTQLQTKYGVTGDCPVESKIISQFAGWHFNVVGEDSESFSSPVGTCAGTGMFPQLAGTDNISQYAMTNLSGTASQPVVNIGDAWPPSITSTIGFIKSNAEGLPDVFGPYFSSFATGHLARGSLNQITSPWQIVLLRDDTDGVACTGAGPDFAGSQSGHTACDVAYVIDIAAPIVTLSNQKALYGGGQPWPQMFNDPKDYTKTDVGFNPYGTSTTSAAPTSCSISSPCTLQDYLCGISGVSLYATIAALNTAWSTSYTTCGSAATNVTAAAIGTGDGTTTSFTVTLHTNVDPHSVQILLGGTVIGGDLPQFAKQVVGNIIQGKTCNPASGHGTLATGGQLASTTPADKLDCALSDINYATGVITVVFQTAPSAATAITANYAWGGWPRNGPGGGGLGLMDEDGGLLAGVTAPEGTNGDCLIASLIYPGTCANGDISHAMDANATTGADLENYIKQYASKYACVIQTANEAGSGVGVPNAGLNTTGAWGSPPARGWIQGQSQCTQTLFLDSNTFDTAHFTDVAARYAFFSQYAVNSIPLLTETFNASSVGPGGCGGAICQASEAAKGTRWFNLITTEQGTDTFDSKKRISGITYWSPYRCLTGCGGDSSDYAIKTGSDNAIDGNEDSSGAVSCSAPLAAFTCGSEPVTYTSTITAGSWATGSETLTIGSNVIPQGGSITVSGSNSTPSIDGTYTTTSNNSTTTTSVKFALASAPSVQPTAGTVTWTSPLTGPPANDLIGTTSNGKILNGNILWLATTPAPPASSPAPAHPIIIYGKYLADFEGKNLESFKY